MEQLKRFYHQLIYSAGLPAFDELSDNEKKDLSNTLSFARFRLGEAFAQFKFEIKKVAPFKWFACLLFCIISISNVQAQKKEWLFGLNKDSARLLADDVMSNMQGKYRFESETDFTDDGANYLEFIYTSDSIKNNVGKPVKYSVYFQKFNRPGTRYYITKLEGNTIEISRIWQTYIDADLNKEKLFEKGTNHTKKIFSGNKQTDFLLTGDNDDWIIYFRYLKL